MNKIVLQSWTKRQKHESVNEGEYAFVCIATSVFIYSQAHFFCLLIMLPETLYSILKNVPQI